MLVFASVSIAVVFAWFSVCEGIEQVAPWIWRLELWTLQQGDRSDLANENSLQVMDFMPSDLARLVLDLLERSCPPVAERLLAESPHLAELRQQRARGRRVSALPFGPTLEQLLAEYCAARQQVDELVERAGLGRTTYGNSFISKLSRLLDVCGTSATSPSMVVAPASSQMGPAKATRDAGSASGGLTGAAPCCRGQSTSGSNRDSQQDSGTTAERTDGQTADAVPRLRQRTESPEPHQRMESPEPHQWTESPVPQKRTESPEPHQRTESPELHQRTEPPEPHQRTEPPEPHQRTESPEPHQRTESPEPHQRTESPEPHQRTGSREPHQRTESPEPHQRTESPEPHQRTESREPHQRTESPEFHQRTESPEPHQRTESPEPHQRTESPEPHQRTESSEPHQRTEPRESHQRTESTVPHQRTESPEPHQRTESPEPHQRTESREPHQRTESPTPQQRSESPEHQVPKPPEHQGLEPPVQQGPEPPEQQRPEPPERGGQVVVERPCAAGVEGLEPIRILVTPEGDVKQLIPLKFFQQMPYNRGSRRGREVIAGYKYRQNVVEKGCSKMDRPVMVRALYTPSGEEARRPDTASGSPIRGVAGLLSDRASPPRRCPSTAARLPRLAGPAPAACSVTAGHSSRGAPPGKRPRQVSPNRPAKVGKKKRSGEKGTGMGPGPVCVRPAAEKEQVPRRPAGRGARGWVPSITAPRARNRRYRRPAPSPPQHAAAAAPSADSRRRSPLARTSTEEAAVPCQSASPPDNPVPPNVAPVTSCGLRECFVKLRRLSPVPDMQSLVTSSLVGEEQSAGSHPCSSTVAAGAVPDVAVQGDPLQSCPPAVPAAAAPRAAPVFSPPASPASGTAEPRDWPGDCSPCQLELRLSPAGSSPSASRAASVAPSPAGSPARDAEMEPAEDWPGSVNQARQEERTHQGGHGVKAGAEFPAAEARMLNPQCCDRDTPPSQRRLVIALSPRSNDTPTDGSASGQRALPRRRLLRDRSSTPEQAVVSSGGRTRSRSSGGRTRSRSRCRLSEGASTPARASPRTSAVKSPATPVGAYARQILKSRGSARTLLKGVNIASFLARIHDGGPS